MASSSEQPVPIFLRDAGEFRAWLEAHHDTATELWMGLYKQHVPDRGLIREQAVPEALCFGWIDSRSERIDDDTMRQRWTPRRPASVWSKVDIALVERLRAEGRMHPAGLAAYERRRADRSGVYSHEAAARDLPPEYAVLLAAAPAAAAFWAETIPSYRKVATHWVLSAKKPETCVKRMALVADSAAGRLIAIVRSGAAPAWLARAAAAAADAAADGT